VPLRRIEAVPPLPALLVSVTVPVADPAVVGANCTLSVAVWLGFSVSGKVIPDMLKPAPLRLPLLMISGVAPLDVRVTGSIAVVLMSTLPNATFVALRVSAGTAAFSCSG